MIREILQYKLDEYVHTLIRWV